METKQDVFKQFMNEFVKLNTEQKSAEIIEKQKIILAYLLAYSENHGLNYSFLKSAEIDDINNKFTQDDYLEAMMVYLENIEELVGLILSTK